MFILFRQGKLCQKNWHMCDKSQWSLCELSVISHFCHSLIVAVVTLLYHYYLINDTAMSKHIEIAGPVYLCLPYTQDIWVYDHKKNMRWKFTIWCYLYLSTLNNTEHFVSHCSWFKFWTKLVKTTYYLVVNVLFEITALIPWAVIYNDVTKLLTS